MNRLRDKLVGMCCSNKRWKDGSFLVVVLGGAVEFVDFEDTQSSVTFLLYIIKGESAPPSGTWRTASYFN